MLSGSLGQGLWGPWKPGAVREQLVDRWLESICESRQTEASWAERGVVKRNKSILGREHSILFLGMYWTYYLLSQGELCCTFFQNQASTVLVDSCEKLGFWAALTCKWIVANFQKWGVVLKWGSHWRVEMALKLFVGSHVHDLELGLNKTSFFLSWTYRIRTFPP